MDGAPAGTADDARGVLLRLYEQALPHVYGYLLTRCGRSDIAEDLTSETFLAAADAVRRPHPPRVDVPWLIGVARHKLADHWRRQSRDRRRLGAIAAAPNTSADDPWDARLEAVRAAQTLDVLAPQYRLALTLRYVDDLPVPEVAALMERTVHATEAVLVRARAAFRAAYTASGGGENDRA